MGTERCLGLLSLGLADVPRLWHAVFGKHLADTGEAGPNLGDTLFALERGVPEELALW